VQTLASRLTELLNASSERARGRLAAFERGHEQRLKNLEDVTRRSADRLEVRQAQQDHELQARVADILARRKYDDLTRRELKFATSNLKHASFDRVVELVEARSDAWDPLVIGYFRNWESLEQFAALDGLVQLLTRAPMTAAIVPRVHPRESYLGREGPKKLGLRFGTRSLRDLWALLDRLGMRKSWQFALHAVAWWVDNRSQVSAIDELWGELATIPEVAIQLLPTLSVGRGAWFKGTAGATGPAPRASARTLVGILRSILRSSGGLSETVATSLLASELGDPRLAGESLGWQRARETDRTVVEAFVSQLVREDLALFFEHAMRDPARARFWLRYLPHIRRTVTLLTPSAHDELRGRLAGAQDGARSALLRTRRFRRDQGVSAFCLYFDRMVIVEFSVTGNAAYVYGRAHFEQLLGPRIDKGGITAFDQLKVRGPGIERILHHSGWQVDTAGFLGRYGIEPQRKA